MSIRFPDAEPVYTHAAQLPIQKLRDATKTLLEAERIWQKYIAGSDLRLETGKDLEQHALTTTVRLGVPPPTEELSALLRTSVNDGRSALDNLITSLARDHGGNEKQVRNVAFPVLMTASAWEKHRWDHRLSLLPKDTVARLKSVQPFISASDDMSGPPHPLAILHELWNADKHRGSFSAAIGLSPAAGTSELGSFNFPLAKEHRGTFEESIDVDQMLELNYGPVVDGFTLLVMRVPKGVKLEDVSPISMSAEFTLGIIGPRVSIADSAIGLLDNALRYSHDTVRFITGGVDAVPVDYPSGLVTFAEN